MNDFITLLCKKIEVKISEENLESETVLRRSMLISSVYVWAFKELKNFIKDYVFSCEQDEIEFFKFTKPSIVSQLIYHSRIYYIELHRPPGYVDVQKEYLNNEHASILEFINNNREFYRYYRSGHTHLDREYFLRENSQTDFLHDIFQFERDPSFSTSGDLKVSSILANDMIELYLKSELEKLDHSMSSSEVDLPKEKPTWSGKKNDLIELIYSLHADSCFNYGNISLAQLSQYFGAIFNVDLGYVSRNFNEMKIRNDPSPFLDRLRKKLLERMGRN